MMSVSFFQYMLHTAELNAFGCTGVFSCPQSLPHMCMGALSTAVSDPTFSGNGTNVPPASLQDGRSKQWHWHKIIDVPRAARAPPWSAQWSSAKGVRQHKLKRSILEDASKKSPSDSSYAAAPNIHISGCFIGSCNLIQHEVAPRTIP